MHGSRFKPFLGFGEFCSDFSSVCWIGSGFKGSAEELFKLMCPVHMRLQQIHALEKIGE